MAKRKTTEQFIQEAQKVHDGKYDYSKVNYVNNHTKVNIICPIHGEFVQSTGGHLVGKGCLKCSPNALKTDNQFITKSITMHGDKYDYSKVNYVNNNTKVKIICPEHGEFEQIPRSHMSGFGCVYCKQESMRLDTNVVIDKFKNVHGDLYNYDNVNYIDSNTKVDIVCKKHGNFKQRIDSHLSGCGCPNCKTSSGELLIIEKLNECAINYKPQYKFVDCKDKRPLSFDFYLPEHNTCIEFDGEQHFRPIEYFGGIASFHKIQKRDDIKNKYCKKT